jgi:lysophospholipase L1-like esterase
MVPRLATTAVERGQPRALYRPTVRGAGGTGFVAANPEYDIPPYLAQINDGALDVRNPALVVIAGGSNDIGQPVDQIKKNARKILRIARKKYPRALLVLVGPMDPYGGYADSIPIRDALHAVAKRLNVPFIDDMTWLAGHPEWLCDDYVHPTYAAHGPLGQRLAKALRKRGA